LTLKVCARARASATRRSRSNTTSCSAQPSCAIISMRSVWNVPIERCLICHRRPALAFIGDCETLQCSRQTHGSANALLFPRQRRNHDLRRARAEFPSVEAVKDNAVRASGEMLRGVNHGQDFWSGEPWKLWVTDGPKGTGKTIHKLGALPRADAAGSSLGRYRSRAGGAPTRPAPPSECGQRRHRSRDGATFSFQTRVDSSDTARGRQH
jgi:hypothetical protein